MLWGVHPTSTVTAPKESSPEEGGRRTPTRGVASKVESPREDQPVPVPTSRLKGATDAPMATSKIPNGPK